MSGHGTGAPAAIVLVVPEALARERLDRALAVLLPGETRASLQRWIAEGRVRSGGRALKASTRLAAGTELEIEPAPPPISAAIPEDLPLVVVHEDADLVIVDKPAGLVVHPAAGHPSGTLVNALLFRYGALAPDAGAPVAVDADESEGEGDVEPASRALPMLRPGIVHRIDKDTSGLLVVARSATAREGLMRLFAAHDVERSYLAITVGEPPETITIDTLHGRHPTDRKRFSGRVTRGKPARTHVTRLEALGGAALVRCELETGRTHQIRVHLSELGFPLLGDALYGRPPKDPELSAIARRLGRHALHAAVLGFVHPVTGARLRFESPLPPELAEALEALRARARARPE